MAPFFVKNSMRTPAAFLMSVLMSGCLSSAALAQNSTPDLGDPVTVLEDLQVNQVVTATELRRRVDDFIETNMAPPRGRPLARWNKPVCIGVAQLSAATAQSVVDRVAQRIIEVGGDVAGPGCRVDVMIVGTDDGAAMAKSLVREDPISYRPATGATDRGSRALAAFQRGVMPVRWWHVSLPVSVDTGEIAIALHGDDAPFVSVRDASRLRTNVRDDLARVLIIVDFSAMPKSVNAGALVDYIAFVALAQVNPGGNPSGQDSILNLFDNPEAYFEMTQWDLDYLSGLYSAVQNRPHISRHAQGIADRVIQGRRNR